METRNEVLVGENPDALPRGWFSSAFPPRAAPFGGSLPSATASSYIRDANARLSQLHAIRFRWLSEQSEKASALSPETARIIDAFILAVRKRANEADLLTITFTEGTERLRASSFYSVMGRDDVRFELPGDAVRGGGGTLTVKTRGLYEDACLTVPLAPAG